MITIRPAVSEDLDQLVGLQSRLFEEDAAVHDTYIDLTWSGREGHGDLSTIMTSETGLVLAAEADQRLVGMLIGYTAESSPTRQPVTFANLRSLYVDREYRRHGVGKRLTEEFVTWAKDQGCSEAHVSSYVANETAQSLYDGFGFAARSLTRVLPL